MSFSNDSLLAHRTAISPHLSLKVSVIIRVRTEAQRSLRTKNLLLMHMKWRSEYYSQISNAKSVCKPDSSIIENKLTNFRTTYSKTEGTKEQTISSSLRSQFKSHAYGVFCYNEALVYI